MFAGPLSQFLPADARVIDAWWSNAKSECWVKHDERDAYFYACAHTSDERLDIEYEIIPFLLRHQHHCATSAGGQTKRHPNIAHIRKRKTIGFIDGSADRNIVQQLLV